MSKPNGYVLWSGASLIDGAPVVAIVTGTASGSTNRKTGAMLQTYILRSDVEPTEAVRLGLDGSICGDCPHRGVPNVPPGLRAAGLTLEPGQVPALSGRTCYVNVGQGPLGVYRAYKRGNYPAAYAPASGLESMADIARGKLVRLGTYGDPAAVPVGVWRVLLRHATGHTGYTHQWRKAPQLRDLCMASADSFADLAEAHSAGWRTFRVATPRDGDARFPAEVVCPASAEAGKKLTCAECLACCGAATGRRGSIVIQAHGGFAVSANIKRRFSA